MRSKDFGLISGLAETFSKEDTLLVYKNICVTRAFEMCAKKIFDDGHMKIPIYLSLGQEAVAAALAVAFKKPRIFAQHRAHDLYLSYGGIIPALVDELLGRPSGCARGMGGSASIHSPEIGMYGHSGLMGDQIPIAVGYALGTGNRTLAVMGDASAEEDYVLAALGYAVHKRLPILFVCVDNGLSILTKTEVRRNWKMVDIARAFGMPAIEITDDPWLIMHHAKQLAESLPAFMNIHVCRHLWHSGTGVDGPPEWNRFELVQGELKNLDLENAGEKIRVEAETEIQSVWEKQLAIHIIQQ